MSKITLTQNYNLITYSGISDKLILRDLSHNFGIIDAEMKRENVELEALQDRMEAAESDIMTHASEISQIKETHAADVSELQSEITTNKEAAENSLQGYITSNDAAVGALDTRLTAAENDIKLLQPETIEEVVERLGIAEDNIANNAELIEGMTTRLSDDEDNLSQHAIRLDALDGKTETLATLIGNVGTEVTELQTDITTLLGEVVKWQEDVSELDKSLSEGLHEIQGLQDLVRAQTAQIGTIAAQITDLQKRMTTTEAKVIDLDGRVRALEQK